MPPEITKKETKGSYHYKTEGVEPLDLLRSGGMLRDFALANIIKYAFRSREQVENKSQKIIDDMEKIIHYAEIVKEMMK